MKQFLIEWCINLSIIILVVIYVGNFLILSFSRGFR